MKNNNFEVGNTGWICPKCGRVYSPFHQMCNYCGPNQFVLNTPAVNKPIDIIQGGAGAPIAQYGSINRTLGQSGIIIEEYV